MDGYEVARRLRQLEPTRRALLVALTGYGQPADRQRSREAGFDEHLLKPVDPATLEALIAHASGGMSGGAPGEGATLYAFRRP